MKTVKNKGDIANEAIELFRQNGYDNVSVKDICEKCGVARSSFYTMFSDKKDILVFHVSRVKTEFDAVMPEFVKAPNDLERIWIITDAFLKQALMAGVDLCRAYLILEIKGECNVLGLIEGFNDWLAQLIDNCRDNGIAQVQGDSSELIMMEINLAKAIFLDWIRFDGKFPLRKAVRHNIEVFLEVKPEYRKDIE